jgi:hypothetical protein
MLPYDDKFKLMKELKYGNKPKGLDRTNEDTLPVDT